MPSCRAAGEEQNGTVGTADEQKQENAGEEQAECAAGVLRERRDNWLKLHAELLRIVCRDFLGELVDNGIKFLIGGRQADVSPETIQGSHAPDVVTEWPPASSNPRGR